MAIIRLEKVEKLYKGSSRKWPAVLSVNLIITQGEFVCFAGKRGSGTSTVLHLITGEHPPDRGAVYFNHIDIANAGKRQRRRIDDCMGKVMQYPTLTGEETVFDKFCRVGRARVLRINLVERPRIKKALSLVGMPGSETRKLNEFSQAELRRIELAKAILHSPQVIVIDDIADQMDDESLWDVVNLLRELNRRGTTIIMAAHNGKVINIVRPRVVTLADGKVVSDVKQGTFGEAINL